MKIKCIAFFFCFVWMATAGSVFAGHGITLNGQLKYSPDFKHFDYVSDKAVKGGVLKLHSLGSFDKMNPFTLKGEAPLALEMFVFDSLGVASLDEPSTEYGLIASDIEVAEDLLSVVFTINQDAEFSDGSPVTVKDIGFSLETLKSDKVHPHYPYYYKDISGYEILDEHRIRFNFVQPNRELAMISAQIPVFSEKSFGGTDWNSSSNDPMTPPIGSGPYVVSKVIQGKSIIYKRNKNYWALNHPVRKGMYNFDTIVIKYYKDPIVALEAYKAGEFDVISINIAKQWARDMVGPRFESGDLVKKLFPHKNSAGMQGFVMNTRREVFQNIAVRKAVGLAFDFEWTNKSLFYGQYTRNNSFFSNSRLAATGVPQGLELDYLNEYKNEVPKEVFTTPLTPPVANGRKGLRANLKKAKSLLAAAGYTVEGGGLLDAKGKPVSFEIILASQVFEKVMAPFVKNLKTLGMQVNYRTIDPTLYTERMNAFDFDMVVSTYGQSLSPGNEQRNFWHSEAALKPGSRNYAGIQSEVVDALIDKIIYAKDDEQLTAACKALDRVLWYGYYLVPNWYMSGHRISYANKFMQPTVLPKYYSATPLLMTWWAK